jgi:SOS response associated peptidase (SRAP)
MPADGSGQELYTCTILTVDSSKQLAWLHDRMPAILPDAASQEAWLQGADQVDLHKLTNQVCTHTQGCTSHSGPPPQWPYLRGSRVDPTSWAQHGQNLLSSWPDIPCCCQVLHPFSGESLQWHPVTQDMNSPAFDGPQCCQVRKRWENNQLARKQFSSMKQETV